MRRLLAGGAFELASRTRDPELVLLGRAARVALIVLLEKIERGVPSEPEWATWRARRDEFIRAAEEVLW